MGDEHQTGRDGDVRLRNWKWRGRERLNTDAPTANTEMLLFPFPLKSRVARREPMAARTERGRKRTGSCDRRRPRLQPSSTNNKG